MRLLGVFKDQEMGWELGQPQSCRGPLWFPCQWYLGLYVNIRVSNTDLEEEAEIPSEPSVPSYATFFVIRGVSGKTQIKSPCLSPTIPEQTPTHHRMKPDGRSCWAGARAYLGPRHELAQRASLHPACKALPACLRDSRALLSLPPSEPTPRKGWDFPQNLGAHGSQGPCLRDHPQGPTVAVPM